MSLVLSCLVIESFKSGIFAYEEAQEDLVKQKIILELHLTRR